VNVTVAYFGGHNLVVAILDPTASDARINVWSWSLETFKVVFQMQLLELYES
jgi:hypothetical protein